MKLNFSKISAFILSAIITLTGNMTYIYAAEGDESSNYEIIEEFDMLCPSDTFNLNKSSKIEPRTHITYKVTQTGITSEIGDYTGQSVSGAPGVTISLSQMKSVSLSASSNVAWDVRQIAQATLGFNFSASTTLQHSGTYSVPTYYNGKKVKRAEIKAYALYDKYTFKVTWTSARVKTPQFYGNYWAKKPSGYHYKVVYYY